MKHTKEEVIEEKKLRRWGTIAGIFALVSILCLAVTVNYGSKNLLYGLLALTAIFASAACTLRLIELIKVYQNALRWINERRTLLGIPKWTMRIASH